MNILIDILHPAHVHFFRHSIKILERKKHKVMVTAREKGVTHDLLRAYDIDFISTGESSNKKIGLAFELLKRNIKLIRLAKKNKIDLFLGIAGISIAMVGYILKKPRIVFYDTEATGLANKIAFPLATRLYTPKYFEEDHGEKHIRYDGLQEYSYLSKKYFQPDKSILQKYGFEPYTYSLCRFSEWKASHDINKHGFSKEMKIKIVKEMQKYGDVIVSFEGEKVSSLEKFEIKVEPHEFHDILAFSKILVSDASTITTEAALLGVPVIRSNSLIGTNFLAGNTKALEESGLMFNIKSEKKALIKMKQLLAKEKLREEWDSKLDAFLNNKIDTNKLIIDIVEEYQKRNKN